MIKTPWIHYNMCKFWGNTTIPNNQYVIISTVTEFQGPECCCADDPVSFHYVSEERMYEMDYLIYRVGRNLAKKKLIQDSEDKKLNRFKTLGNQTKTNGK